MTDPAPAPRLVYAVSADYARFTGGWVYNEALLDGLAGLGWRIERLTLPAGFPEPPAGARAAALARLAALPAGTLVLGDQICLSVLPELFAAAHLRIAVIAHHPMLHEGGPRAERLAALEARALPLAALVIANSAATRAELLRDWGVAPGRLVLAPPGTPVLPQARGSGQGGCALLSVGAVVPRKGHDLLVAALAPLATLDWRLTIVGDTGRAPDHLTALRAAIADAGLADRIRLTGALAEVEPLWDGADAYVAAARHEGFGMAVAEALARGLPTVTAASGAVEGWLPPGAALLARSQDELTRGLARLIAEPATRRSLAAAARAAAPRLPRWQDCAATADAALRPLSPR